MRRAMMLTAIAALGGVAAGASAVPDLSSRRPALGMRVGMPGTRAETLAMVRAHFKALDRNHDGVIVRAELPVPSAPALSSASSIRGFEAMDLDHDGKLSPAEIEAARGRTGRIPRPAIEMRASPPDDGPPPPPGKGGARMMGLLFDAMDANRDGKLTLAEAERGAFARFDRADTNHDGNLDADERMAAWPRATTRMQLRGTPAPPPR